jgi:hypothetical protein
MTTLNERNGWAQCRCLLHFKTQLVLLLFELLVLREIVSHLTPLPKLSFHRVLVLLKALSFQDLDLAQEIEHHGDLRGKISEQCFVRLVHALPKIDLQYAYHGAKIISFWVLQAYWVTHKVTVTINVHVGIERARIAWWKFALEGRFTQRHIGGDAVRMTKRYFDLRVHRVVAVPRRDLKVAYARRAPHLPFDLVHNEYRARLALDNLFRKEFGTSNELQWRQVCDIALQAMQEARQLALPFNL